MNNDLPFWEINDHNEIYIIKAESMKKSYDGIVKKLQKERIKYVKQSNNEEKQDSQLSSELISQFAQLKHEFVLKYQTKLHLQRSQLKIKKRYELIQEQLKEQSKSQQLQQQLKEQQLAQTNLMKK